MKLAPLAALVFSFVLLHARADAARCGITVFDPRGVWQSHAMRGSGPGLILSGGGGLQMPYREALRWAQRLTNGPSGHRAGNLLVLSASGGRTYTDLWYVAAPFAAVREITIPPCASRRDLNALVPIVNASDVVFFKGGDQANYVGWKNSAFLRAISNVYQRGGVVGGGSAGLAIQGAVIFDSVAADRVLGDVSVATADAVANPLEPAISFTTGYFAWPALARTMTDTHFARRDRFGRSAAFLARSLRDRLVSSNTMYGLGIDEDAVLLVDARGRAVLRQPARGDDGYRPRGAFLITAQTPQRLSAPLRFTVSVLHVAHDGDALNLRTHRGRGKHYNVTVDGSRRPMYSVDPYSGP